MRIAVYSGSFNPLHIGHLAIIGHLSSGEEFDCVYLVVSPKNPLKDSISADTGESRFRAAQEAVGRHPGLKVRVDSIELNMPPPQYTIRTLDALKKREPENEFTLIIGADNLSSIRQWRDYRRILSEYGVSVYPRTGFDMAAAKEDLMKECGEYRIELLDAPVMDISSTEIREGMANGKDMSQFLM